MWGQARVQAHAADKAGIIPTRVGTSYVIPVNVSNVQDHPHACGDKGKFISDEIQGIGSSPRVWGQDR